jgi:hypothetical protein
MHPAGGVLNDREAVQPDERGRLGMKEITREDPVRAETLSTSRHLRVFIEDAAKAITAPDLELI